MGNCDGCDRKKEQAHRDKVTDDVTGIRRPIDAPDTELLNISADLEEEETITALDDDIQRRPEQV